MPDYFPAGYTNPCERFGEYVLKSADGGDTWQVTATLPYTGCVGGLLDIAVLDGGNTLLAVSSKGDVIRSENAGTTWTTVEKGVTSRHLADIGGMPIVTDPSRPSSAWVCSVDQFGGPKSPGLLSTRNGGKTWQLHRVRVGSKAIGGCYGLAVQPGGRVVLAYGDIATRRKGGGVTYPVSGRYRLFRSTDSGVHWKQIGCYVACPNNPTAVAEWYATHYGTFYFDPRRSRTVLATGGGYPLTANVVFRSDDAGVHWRPVVLIGSKTRSGALRIYTKFEYRAKLKGRHYYVSVTDMSGRRLYPRADITGQVSAIKGTLLIDRVDSVVVDARGHPHYGATEFLASTDHGRRWSLFNAGAGHRGSVAVTGNGILVSDGSPSALWHFRLSDRTWRKLPLGVPNPIEPTPGYWSSTDGFMHFYLSTDRGAIHTLVFHNPNPVNHSSPDGTLHCSSGGDMGVSDIPVVLDPIAGSSFSYTDADTSISGKFDSATTAHGTVEQKGTDSCGPWDTGEVPWTASWRDSSQPSS